jgi:hypothetical protein
MINFFICQGFTCPYLSALLVRTCPPVLVRTCPYLSALLVRLTCPYLSVLVRPYLSVLVRLTCPYLSALLVRTCPPVLVRPYLSVLVRPYLSALLVRPYLSVLVRPYLSVRTCPYGQVRRRRRSGDWQVTKYKKPQQYEAHWKYLMAKRILKCQKYYNLPIFVGLITVNFYYLSRIWCRL